MADLPAGWLKKCEKFLDEFAPVIDELHAMLTNNAIFIHRMGGVGVMPAAMAIDYGCTGPVLRGSGVDWDLRRDGEPIYTQMYDGYTLAGHGPDRRQLSDGSRLSARATRGRGGRLLAPVLRSHGGMRAVDGLDPPGDGEILESPRRGRWTDRSEEKTAQGGGVPRNRGPEGANGIYDYQQRHAGSVAGAASAAAVSAISR